MISRHVLLIALMGSLISFQATAQSAASDDSQPNGAKPTPELTNPKRAKKTRAEKRALTEAAETSGAGSNSASPNGSGPIPEAKAPKRAKRTPAEKKSLTAEAEKAGAGSNSAVPNGSSPLKAPAK